MKKQLHITVLLLFVILSSLYSQQSNLCGTTDFSEIKERLLYNKKLLSGKTVNTRSIDYIPVKFHLIGNDDGKGVVKVSQVLEFLCSLNEFYQPYSIQFYIKDGFDYINNTQLSMDPSGGEQVLLAKKVKQTINIFISQMIANWSQGYYIQGFNFSHDYIVLSKSVVGSGKLTGLHELGHFFGLLHTFSGWESYPYDSTLYGNPLSILISPEGAEIEFVDKSNCETTADLICDTPPDYNFFENFLFPTYCKPFDGTIKDYHGDPIFPVYNNIMSNNEMCSDFTLTLQQASLIQTDIDIRNSSTGNNKIPSETVPNLSPIDQSIFTSNIDNNSTITSYGDIFIDWNDIPGASSYYIEIDGATSFSSPKFQSTVVNNSEWKAKGLLKNTKYYWHVFPFNEYNTCVDSLKYYTFTTGTTLVSTKDIDEVSNWSIVINPIQKNSSLVIEYNCFKSFTGSVIVSDISGKEIYNLQNEQFKEGNQTIEIPINNVVSGFYTVQLKTNNGVETKKLIVN